jgi:hypothetical protein
MSSVYGQDNSVGLGSVILVVTFLTILAFGGMIWFYLNEDGVASGAKVPQAMSERTVEPGPDRQVEQPVATL